MPMKKRTMALVLAALMLLGLGLTACSGTGSGGGAATTASGPAKIPPAKITMFMGTAGIAIPEGVDIADNPYINKLQELANVEITELTVPPYADFATRLTLMLSSNTIPDLVHCWQSGEIGKAGAAGAFLELTDVIKNSSVLSETYNEEMINLCRYSDSNVYYLRTLAAPDPGPVVGARWDLIKEINDSVIPETVDGWYDLFVKEKSVYPDCVPVSDFNGIGSTLRTFFMAYGVVPYGWQYTFGEYIHCFESTYIRESVQFVKSLYDEGLLSKTFVTNTQQDLGNERLTKKTIYSGNNYASVAGGVNKDDPSIVTVPAPVPKTDLSGIDPINAIPGVAKLGWHVAAINAKTKELAGCVRMIETLLSDESAFQSVWGIEGTDFEYKNGEKTPIVPASTDNYYRRIFGFMFTYNTADAIQMNIGNNLNTYLTDDSLKKEYRAKMDEGAAKIFELTATVPSIKPTDFVVLSEEGTNKRVEGEELAKTIILRAITGEINMSEFDKQMQDFLAKYKSVTDEYNAKLAEVKTKYGYE